MGRWPSPARPGRAALTARPPASTPSPPSARAATHRSEGGPRRRRARRARRVGALRPRVRVFGRKGLSWSQRSRGWTQFARRACAARPSGDPRRAATATPRSARPRKAVGRSSERTFDDVQQQHKIRPRFVDAAKTSRSSSAKEFTSPKKLWWRRLARRASRPPPSPSTARSRRRSTRPRRSTCGAQFEAVRRASPTRGRRSVALPHPVRGLPAPVRHVSCGTASRVRSPPASTQPVVVRRPRQASTARRAYGGAYQRQPRRIEALRGERIVATACSTATRSASPPTASSFRGVSARSCLGRDESTRSLPAAVPLPAGRGGAVLVDCETGTGGGARRRLALDVGRRRLRPPRSRRQAGEAGAGLVTLPAGVARHPHLARLAHGGVLRGRGPPPQPRPQPGGLPRRRTSRGTVGGQCAAAPAVAAADGATTGRRRGRGRSESGSSGIGAGAGAGAGPGTRQGAAHVGVRRPRQPRLGDRKDRMRPTVVRGARGARSRRRRASSASRARAGRTAARAGCTRGPGQEGPHTLAVGASGSIYSRYVPQGQLRKLGDEDGGFGEPYDELAFAVSRDGARNRQHAEAAAISPFGAGPRRVRHDGEEGARGGVWPHPLSARRRRTAVGVGLRLERRPLRVERFSTARARTALGVDTLKCYMMGPHRVGCARPRYWPAAPRSTVRVIAVATGQPWLRSASAAGLRRIPFRPTERGTSMKVVAPVGDAARALAPRSCTSTMAPRTESRIDLTRSSDYPPCAARTPPPRPGTHHPRPCPLHRYGSPSGCRSPVGSRPSSPGISFSKQSPRLSSGRAARLRRHRRRLRRVGGDALVGSGRRHRRGVRATRFRPS